MCCYEYGLILSESASLTYICIIVFFSPTHNYNYNVRTMEWNGLIRSMYSMIITYSYTYIYIDMFSIIIRHIRYFTHIYEYSMTLADLTTICVLLDGMLMDLLTYHLLESVDTVAIITSNVDTVQLFLFCF